MLKILIADDHEFIREGLKKILIDEFSPVHIGEAEDTDRLLALAPTEEWNIIISDISMPGKGGIEALSILKEQQPHIPVLILSIYPKDQYADNVLNAGAAGYLNKDSAPAELVQVVKEILNKDGLRG
ncbi:MAG: response regulator transcription factor [Chitinophagaceae bacterium]|nr:response regulator transcription factor [Chitinophagaceae bacterium]